jgi:hypothetical protein
LKAIACQAAGQAHDLRETAALISGLSAGHLLADRALDADWLRNDLLERDITPVIPPKSNRKFSATFDKGNLQMAAPDRKLLRQVEGKQRDSHTFVQNRPEF